MVWYAMASYTFQNHGLKEKTVPHMHASQNVLELLLTLDIN